MKQFDSLALSVIYFPGVYTGLLPFPPELAFSQEKVVVTNSGPQTLIRSDRSPCILLAVSGTGVVRALYRVVLE